MSKYITFLYLLINCAYCFAGDINSVQSASPKSLAFIENKGQVTDQYYKPRHDIDFKLEAGGGLNIFIGSGTIHYQFAKPVDAKPVVGANSAQLRIDRSSRQRGEEYQPQAIEFEMYRMDVELIGANKNAEIIREGKLDYYENHYTTGTGENGATVYPYSKITYKSIYPGIDWVLYTNNNQLKHEFVVHAGGHSTDIQLKYNGATKLKLNEDGSLTATTPLGEITEEAPISYIAEGQKVASNFVLIDDVLSYETGDYRGILVIDPGLDWSTYFGDYYGEIAFDISVDSVESVYICGNVYSAGNKIATSGAHQLIYADSGDSFLAKFDSTGKRLWATYYGTTSLEESCYLATDTFGNIFITGWTFSINGLATPGAHKINNNWSMSCFLAKFNPTGTRQWGTYYGGAWNDDPMSIATDKTGNVYIAGTTSSTSGVASTGAHQVNLSGVSDGFIAKFNSSGLHLWGTYFGGASGEWIQSIITDDTGNVYIGGFTNSTSGIRTSGVHKVAKSLSEDAFLAKFDSTGTQKWGTYYGGDGGERIQNVTINSSGDIFLTGYTESTNGISTSGAHQPVNSGKHDAFLSKFSNNGLLKWGTYCGGSEYDIAYGLVADSKGHIYITGETNSIAGVATSGGTQQSFGGGYRDAFLVMFNDNGARLWGTYYGGGNDDRCYALAIDRCMNIYMAGYAMSNNLTTSGVHQTVLGGGSDAMLTKFYYVPQSLDTIIGSSTICVGDTIAMKNTIPGGTWNTSTGNAMVSTDGFITGISAGVDTLSYTLSSTCKSVSAIKIVSIILKPIIVSHPTPLATIATGNVRFSVAATGAGLGYQWQENTGNGFQNLSNGGQYSGVTTDTLTISNTSTVNNNSKYRCVVTGGSCTDTTSEATLSVWPLDITTVTNEGISIYPNPTKNTITITSTKNIEKVEILNLLGQSMTTQKTNTQMLEIDMSSFAPGMYIIKVNNGNVTRVVKE